MCQGGKGSFFHDKTHKMRYNRSNIMQEAHTMSTQTRVVRLLQNTLYPTYQHVHVPGWKRLVFP